MGIYNLDNLLRNQRLILLVNAFIGLLIIIATLLFIRDVLSISFSPKKKVIVNEKKAERAMRHNLQDYALILKNNPFGFPAGELKPLGSQAASISPADLLLIGTVSGQRSLSYAIFMNKAGEQEVVKSGGHVFGLGILNKVEKDRVFIVAGGNSIEIHLKDIVSGMKDKKTRSPVVRSSRFTRRLSDNTYSIDQRKIQNAIENPKELMTDARLLPNLVEGKQHGFILSEIKPGGIYQSLGLRNGDVLLRINEFDISNPEYALQAFTALRGMDRLQLDILRGGSKMTMTYQIQ